MAGESAREVARKRRDKAERLIRVADAYERGAEGERETAHALAKLPASGWFVLHDVRWPGRRFANIDHVVVGPNGVFVIDSKAWSGVVEVRDGVLRQNGYKREPAVAAAADAAMAVAEVVPGLDPYAAKPVLCFIGDHQLEGWARDVMLCTPHNLVAMLLSRPQVLDGAGVRRTLLHLQEALKAATSQSAAATRSSAPTARSAAASRGRKRGGVGVLTKFLGLVALITLIFVGVHELPKAASPIARRITSQIPSPVASPGRHPSHHGPRKSRTIPAATNRPPLRVTADHAGTVHRIGTLPYLYDGNRFFGVRLRILNIGKRPWVSQPGTSVSVTDANGTSHVGGYAIRIREGAVLVDPVRIPAGGVARGYVVFQVSRDIPITAVSLTVGPGKPRTVTWKIDRQ